MNRVRWSNNDRYVGPFTLAKAHEQQWGLVFCSTDDEGDPAYARLHLGRMTILWPTFGLFLRPHKEKKQAKYWDADTVERLGRDWYWDIHERQVGFTLSGGDLHLYYGKQTQEWPGSKSRVIFLPWTQWRHVRRSLYDADGNLFCDVPEGAKYADRRDMEDDCPVVRFAFLDFDGERITVTTRIEEREWRAGTGWFKWLSLFRKPRVRRSLDLQFSAETGRRKGSWKGGTIGHGIEMLPGELHEGAFRRYCAEHDMTFAGWRWWRRQMPERLQQRSTKGWRKPQGAVIVSRPTIWGNPFTAALARSSGAYQGTDAELAGVCADLFRIWLSGDKADWFGPRLIERRARILSRLPELRGRDLMCWCPPGCPCHADVLLEMANA